MDEVLHLHVLSINGLLETIFSSSKTIFQYLQYGKKLFVSWSCHTPLTGLLDPSPINHSWDIRDCQVHDLNPITQIIGTPAGLTMTTHSTGAGVQMYTQASSEHAQKADRMQL